MSRSRLPPGALLLALALAACAPGDGGRTGAPPQPESGADVLPPTLSAVASLPPLGWLAQRVGGEALAVTVLLPPGASPHAFEPSPRQLAAFDGADLFVAVGHPDLAFEHRLAERLLRRRPDLAVVRLAQDAARTDAGRGAGDPHLWLDPGVMATAADRLTTTLCSLDPAGADGYRARLAALRSELAGLDAYLAARLGPRGAAAAPPRRFFVQHPAWGHLAAAYGLRQVALEREGKEASPQLLVARIEQARAAGARVILVERGAAQRPARAFAAETGAEVVVLDPLAADWLAEMRRTGDALARALTPPAGSDEEKAP